MMRFLVAFDVPSIKQYVFGTDPLREIRGASSRLVTLNCYRMKSVLIEELGDDQVDQVYANGGTAQFIITANTESDVEEACQRLAGVFREETGGEVGLVWGIEEYRESEGDYKRAVQQAHRRLRQCRDSARDEPVSLLMPLVAECKSSSHLPASQKSLRDGRWQLISRAVEQKENVPRESLWEAWMQFVNTHFAQEGWENESQWKNLHCGEFSELVGQENSDLGLVYADGNAMGKVVRKLNTPERSLAFSEMIDQSVQRACHRALAQVCGKDIAQLRRSNFANGKLRAEILLLGGDDLLVALPAERALAFAKLVMEEFQAETESHLNTLDPDLQKYFRADRPFSLSCGVAIGRVTFPFALLLELAEDLLKEAKRCGTAQQQSDRTSVASFLDFHQVLGSGSLELATLRDEDFRISTNRPRTLRPFQITKGPQESPAGAVEFKRLTDAVGILKRCEPGIPRTKLHALREAALTASEAKAEQRSRELFARLTERQRQALWKAMACLDENGRVENFPWISWRGKTPTPLPDLVEAFDLWQSYDSI